MLANAKWQNVSWAKRDQRVGWKLASPRFACGPADGPPQRIKDMGQQHLPGDEAWLIGEHRTVGGKRKYYLANSAGQGGFCAH